MSFQSKSVSFINVTGVCVIINKQGSFTTHFHSLSEIRAGFSSIVVHCQKRQRRIVLVMYTECNWLKSGEIIARWWQLCSKSWPSTKILHTIWICHKEYEILKFKNYHAILKTQISCFIKIYFNNDFIAISNVLLPHKLCYWEENIRA